MSVTEPSPRLGAFFAALTLSAFAFNWVWEMAQMPAYREAAGRPWPETVPTCTLAALGDVAIILAVYGAGALATGDVRWGLSGRWSVYTSAALLGGACAVALEWRAFATGRWSYTDAMPVIPLLGVGLWPVLQLTVLTPTAFGIARYWVRPR